MNKIKAYLLLLTIALSAFAAACSSDDNDPVTPEITISENILANGMSFSKAGGTNTHNGECTLCHLQHEAPVNYCAECHPQFKFNPN